MTPPRIDGPVRRIGVFRALVLGDLLCTVPALRALRAGFPDAQVTLVGLPWARALVERLDALLDDFIEFPGFPGLPERPCDVTALPAFLETVQARRFDLALQLHGSGGIVNPLVALFGARVTAGFQDGTCWQPPPGSVARFVRWPEAGHEIERMLALTDGLGLPRQGLALDFPLRDADRAALAALWPDGGAPARYVCVHAGAQLPSRRWPLARFAEVADWLAGQGLAVVLTGTEAERPLVAELAARMRRPAIDLSGRTTLWTLGALIDGAALLVCNDTGVSHVAAALRRPSVVVSSGADVARWAPLDASRHRVLWQPMACRPCSAPECPFGHGCALAITPARVIEVARELLAAALPHRGARPAGAAVPSLSDGDSSWPDRCAS